MRARAHTPLLRQQGKTTSGHCGVNSHKIRPGFLWLGPLWVANEEAVRSPHCRVTPDRYSRFFHTLTPGEPPTCISAPHRHSCIQNDSNIHRIHRGCEGITQTKWFVHICTSSASGPRGALSVRHVRLHGTRPADWRPQPPRKPCQWCLWAHLRRRRRRRHMTGRPCAHATPTRARACAHARTHARTHTYACPS